MKILKKSEIELIAGGVPCSCLNPDPTDLACMLTRKHFDDITEELCIRECCKKFKSKFYEINYDGNAHKCPED